MAKKYSRKRQAQFLTQMILKDKRVTKWVQREEEREETTRILYHLQVRKTNSNALRHLRNADGTPCLPSEKEGFLLLHHRGNVQYGAYDLPKNFFVAAKMIDKIIGELLEEMEGEEDEREEDGEEGE